MLSFAAQLLSAEGREALAAEHAHVALFLHQVWASGRRHHPRRGASADVVDELLCCSGHIDLCERVFRSTVVAERHGRPHPLWQHLRACLTGASTGVPAAMRTAARPASSEAQASCSAFAAQQLIAAVHFVLEGGRTGRGECAFGSAARDAAMRRVLLRGGLLIAANTAGEGNDAAQIPAKALAFAMGAAAEQWWTLLDAMICDVSDGQPTRGPLLAGLCLMALLRCDCAYAWPARGGDGLGAMYPLLVLMRDVGLVFPFKDKYDAPVFVVPPCLAEALHFGASGSSGNVGSGSVADEPAEVPRSEDDTIITETNFQVYAYTKNRATRALLRQFTTDETTVNDYFTCCRIARESFVDAVARGIKAAQVIKFLSLKAHPAMHRGRERGFPVVPQSICDQLLIWEAESQRVQFVDRCVLVSAPSDAAMRSLKQLLIDAEVLCEGRHALVVSAVVYDRLLVPHLDRAN